MKILLLISCLLLTKLSLCQKIRKNDLIGKQWITNKKIFNSFENDTVRLVKDDSPDPKTQSFRYEVLIVYFQKSKKMAFATPNGNHGRLDILMGKWSLHKNVKLYFRMRNKVTYSFKIVSTSQIINAEDQKTELVLVRMKNKF